jgi:hypothetical protein
MFRQVHYPVRITGFGRLAMRRDVQRLLADCDVHAEDIRCNWQWASGCYRAAAGCFVLLACWTRQKPLLKVLFDWCRLEYDPGTLNPKAFWTDLPTPELQKRAITWNGSNMVSPLLQLRCPCVWVQAHHPLWFAQQVLTLCHWTVLPS